MKCKKVNSFSKIPVVNAQVRKVCNNVQQWKPNILDIPINTKFLWNSCQNSHFQWLLHKWKFHEIIAQCQQLPTCQPPFVHVSWHTEKFLIDCSPIRCCFVPFHHVPFFQNNESIYKYINSQEKSSNCDETKLFYLHMLSSKWFAHNRQDDRAELKHSFWIQMFQKWI